MFHAALGTLEELLSDARIDDIGLDLCEAEHAVQCGDMWRDWRVAGTEDFPKLLHFEVNFGRGLEKMRGTHAVACQDPDPENLVAVLLDKTDVGGGSSKATSPQQVHHLTPRRHEHLTNPWFHTFHTLDFGLQGSCHGPVFLRASWSRRELVHCRGCMRLHAATVAS